MKPHFSNTNNPIDFPKSEMNERIRELAEQCGFRSNPDIYDRNQSFDIKKFAELIVRECMQVTVNYPHPVTKLTAAEHIARYFGVEE